LLPLVVSSVLLTKMFVIANAQVSHPCKEAREIRTLYFNSKYFLFVFLNLEMMQNLRYSLAKFAYSTKIKQKYKKAK